MIDYNPFWETLKESGESTYTLIVRHRMSSATIDKLRKNKPMNTTTLDHLCQILECTLDGIVRYVPDGGESAPEAGSIGLEREAQVRYEPPVARGRS